jgi:hypothetical protein
LGGEVVVKQAVKIVKVQLSIVSSEPVKQALVYDKKHEWFGQFDATPELGAAMKGRPKAFFHATLNDDGVVQLGKEANWQTW